MERSELKGFKIGILLGGGLTKRNRLNKISRRRVKLAYNLLKEGYIETIILSGKYGKKKKTKTEAEVYKEYLLDRGIRTRQIILEEESRDTIGNAVYTKELMIGKRFQKKAMLITNDFHIKRALNIFKFVFGSDFIIVGVTCSTPFFKRTKLKIKEFFLRRVNYRFLKTFTRGNHRKIKELMRKYE